jgi:cytochrome b561
MAKQTKTTSPWITATAISKFRTVLLPKDPLEAEEYENLPQLKFGDSISLYSTDLNGYIFSEGYTDRQCRLQETTNAFYNCVFRVFPRFKYDIQKIYNEQRKRRERGVGEEEKSDTKQFSSISTFKLGSVVGRAITETFVNSLEDSSIMEAALENERQENLLKYQQTVGKEVVYGQVIQLYHVKSATFLTATVKEVATLEKDALKVVLDSEGNEGSWFVVTPRFKSRCEGEPVSFGDQIILENKRFGNLYLHVSSVSGQTEVNVSTHIDKISWKVIPFAQFIPHEERYLKAGDIVRLFHQEVEGYLNFGIHHEYVTRLSESDQQTRTARSSSEYSDEFVSDQSESETLQEGESFGSATTNIYAQHHSNETETPSANQKVFLDIRSDWANGNYNSSNSCWMIELENPERGGAIAFAARCRFKHIATGTYLTLRNAPATMTTTQHKKKGEPTEYVYELETTIDASDPATLFSLHSINFHPGNAQEEKRAIEIEDYIRIRHCTTSCWLHTYVETRHTHRQSTKKETIKNVVVSSRHYDYDVFGLFRVPRPEVDTIFNVVGHSEKLSAFVTKLRNTSSMSFLSHFKTTQQSTPTQKTKYSLATSFDWKGLSSIFEASSFADNTPQFGIPKTVRHAVGAFIRQLCQQDTYNENVAISSLQQFIEFQNPDPYLQQVLREQNVIDLLFEILDLMLKKGNVLLSDIKKPENYALFTYCRNTYILLNLIVKDNDFNRQYASKYLDFIQKQMGYSMKVTPFLLELFKDNKQLLMKLTEQQVKHFLRKLKEENANDQRFFALLSTLCKYKGRPTSRNQNIICKLLDEDSSILVPLKLSKEISSLASTSMELTSQRFYSEAETLTENSSKEEVYIQIQNENREWTRLSDYLKTCSPKILQHLVSSLHLLAELSAGGNLTTKAIINKWVSPYMALVGISDLQLPYALRTAFGYLLLHFNEAAVQEGQLKYVNFIHYTRLWSDLCQDLRTVQYADTELRKSHSVTPLMISNLSNLKALLLSSLKEKTLDYSASLERNQFGVVILRLCEQLFSLGQFTVDELKMMMPLLLHAASARLVTLFEEKESPEFVAIDQCIDEGKLIICKILDKFFDYRIDFRMTKVLELYKSKTVETNFDSSKNFEFDDNDKRVFIQIMKLMYFSEETFLPLIEYLIKRKNEELSVCASKILLRHFSQECELWKALRRVQILANEKFISLYTTIKKHMSFMRKHLAVGFKGQLAELKNVLRQLIAIAGDEQTSHKEHQRILSNLKVPDIVIRVMKLRKLQDRDEVLALCLELLKRFCRDNRHNQMKLFPYLDFFLQYIDESALTFKVSQLLKEIFLNNKTVCSQVSEAQLRKIVNQMGVSKIPIYIDVLSTVLVVNGHLIRRNQKLLSQLLFERQNDILLLYNDVDAVRRRNELILSKNYREENGEIQYHLKLIQLFTRISEGKIYEAEVKCQSLFDLKAIASQILDDTNWPPIRLAFLNLLKELYLETERQIKDIEYSPQVWQILQKSAQEIQNFTEYYTQTIESRKNVEDSCSSSDSDGSTDSAVERSQESPHSSSEESESEGSERSTSNDNESDKDDTASQEDANMQKKKNKEPTEEKKMQHEQKRKERLEKQNMKLKKLNQKQMKAYIFDGLLPFLHNYFAKLFVLKRVTEARQNVVAQIADALIRMYTTLEKHLSTREIITIGTCVEAIFKHQIQNEIFNSSKDVVKNLLELCQKLHRDSDIGVQKESISQQQNEVSRSLGQRESHMNIKTISHSEEDEITRGLKLFWKAGVETFSSATDEQKLVAYLRNDIRKLSNSAADFLITKKLIEFLGRKDIFSSSSDFTLPFDLVVTVERAFRTLIEDEIKRDMPCNNEIAQFQITLNNLGLTRVLISLLMNENEFIVREAFKLGIALLYGGNKVVQQEIFNLLQTNSESFFSGMRQRLKKGVDDLEEKRLAFYKHKEMQKEMNETDEASQLHHFEKSSLSFVGRVNNETTHLWDILRFLQLLCEGHNISLQNFLRFQPNNFRSYDLVSETAFCLESLENSIDEITIDTIIQFFITLTEYCQGPCPDNQSALIKTKLLDSVTYILKYQPTQCAHSKVLKLREQIFITLLSLLEGHTDHTIPRQFLYALNFDDMERELLRLIRLLELKHQNESALSDHEKMELNLGFLSFFLLCTLANYDQEKKLEGILNKLPPNNFFVRSTGSIEIVRNNKLERVYFRIPPVCSHISDSSKENLLLRVKRTTQKDKIQDFFELSEELIQEMNHREKLASHYWFSLFSKYETYILNFTFILSLLINFTVIAVYDSDYPETNWKMIMLLAFFGLLLVAASSIALWLNIQAYAPLILRRQLKEFKTTYEDAVERNSHLWKNRAIVFYILVSDSHLLWYILYVLFATLGTITLPNRPFFFAFHLFDIVKRSELLKDAIKSVTLNGKSILLTLFLTIVVLHIYAIFGFLYFKTHFVKDDQQLCRSMLMCLVNVFFYGSDFFDLLLFRRTKK